MSNNNETWDGKDKYGGDASVIGCLVYIIAFLIIIMHDCS